MGGGGGHAQAEQRVVRHRDRGLAGRVGVVRWRGLGRGAECVGRQRLPEQRGLHVAAGGLRLRAGRRVDRSRGRRQAGVDELAEPAGVEHRGVHGGGPPLGRVVPRVRRGGLRRRQDGGRRHQRHGRGCGSSDPRTYSHVFPCDLPDATPGSPRPPRQVA